MTKDNPRGPLDYAKPKRIGPSTGRVLGMTLGVAILAPLGLIAGLAGPVAMFAGFNSLTSNNKQMAGGLYFLGLGVLSIPIVYLIRIGGALLRVFLILFTVGAILSILVVGLCGMH